MRRPAVLDARSRAHRRAYSTIGRENQIDIATLWQRHTIACSSRYVRADGRAGGIDERGGTTCGGPAPWVLMLPGGIGAGVLRIVGMLLGDFA